MKFKCTRTSTKGYDEVKPCDEAILEQVVSVDERTVADPNELTRMSADDWYYKGQNHRLEDGHIKRDFMIEAYTIELKDIDSLMNFIEQHGEVIIKHDQEAELPEIEIYD